MIKVEIDEGSGFCFGVVTAIHKAEEELAKGVTLYCLGDIVHNSREVERLKTMGSLLSIMKSSSNYIMPKYYFVLMVNLPKHIQSPGKIILKLLMLPVR